LGPNLSQLGEYNWIISQGWLCRLAKGELAACHRVLFGILEAVLVTDAIDPGFDSD